MNTQGDLAAEKFTAGFNCAQSVIWAFADELGLDKNMMLKLSTGFGGGMGHEQEVCGAVSGGIFAIGAKFGRDEGGTRDQTNATYQKVRELFARFRERHGTCLCSELLPDCDLNTPAGQQKFKDSGLRDKVCKECVRDAANLVAELLR
jgi:C_GCAxxG_C_C family probable redox protein